VKRTELKRGTSTLTRSPMKRRGPSRASRTPPKVRPWNTSARVDTGPSEETRALVWARDGGVCRRCGKPGEQIHHRKPRGAGGTSDPATNEPQNLVLLDQACHEWIERNRRACYVLGWLVRRHLDPLEVPILVNVTTSLRLHHDGTTSTERRLEVDR